jgi:hypothetical protein
MPAAEWIGLAGEGIRLAVSEWRKTDRRVDLPARSAAVAIPARSVRAVAR